MCTAHFELGGKAMVLAHKLASIAFLGAVSLLQVACGTSNSTTAPNSAAPQDAAAARDVSTKSGDGTASGCTLDDVSAGQHTYSCDGLTYDVHIPAACASSSCGLVV